MVRASTPATGYAGTGHAVDLEGNAATVRRAPAPGRRHQDRRANHRLRGHRPPRATADMGKAAGRLSGDGVSMSRASSRMIGTLGETPTHQHSAHRCAVSMPFCRDQEVKLGARQDHGFQSRDSGQRDGIPKSGTFRLNFTVDFIDFFQPPQKVAPLLV